MKKLLVFFLFTLLLLACGSDKTAVSDDFEVTVRLEKDPARVNPMLASGSSVSREVYSYIFLPPAEFNPKTLEWVPILIKEIPEHKVITEGEHEGMLSYVVDLLPDAEWQDGTPITAQDYLFTLKAAKNPLVNAPTWRAGLMMVLDVIADSDNPKRFELILKNELNTLENALSTELLPAHIYDPKSSLSSLNFKDFNNEAWLEEKVKDSTFIQFANQFNDREFNINNMSGAGPYRLEEWESDQYITLVRKDNWWGTNYPDCIQLQANPKRIHFQFIPDEVTAITQLKNGGLDIMAVKDGNQFETLRSNDSIDLQFFTPEMLRYYYVGLNNQSPKLSEVSVRRALAHCLDIDELIKQLEFGQGKRLVSNIIPSSEYYNHDLELINLDVDKAEQLLTEAGWKDTDGDGNVDKVVNGEVVNLKLRIFVSKSNLSNTIALLLKENAAKVGIEINLIQKSFGQVRKENLSIGDFEICLLLGSNALAPYDAYGRYHGDNAVDGGSNYLKYKNSELDKTIVAIQKEKNKEEMKRLYKKMQAILYEDQAAIFLYSPITRFAVNKRLNTLISIKRPGYFLNTAELN